MRRYLLVILVLLLLHPGLLPGPAAAQSLTLAADLFVLTDDGLVMRLEAGATFATAVTPTNQRVLDFSPAPDGRWVAYRTGPVDDGSSVPVLAVTSIDGQSGQVLAFEEAGAPPITGRGQTLAWSSDASAIAYTVADGVRVHLAGAGEGGGPVFIDLAGGPFVNLVWSPGSGYLAAEAESNVWNIYRRVGANVVYAGQIPSSAGLAWIQEGVLAVAPPTGGLIALDITTGEQNVLIGVETLVSQPAVVSGNRIVVLVHEASGQRFAARRYGSVSLAGGDFQALEAGVELTAAMRWLPDGVALTATIDGALTVIEPSTNARREIMGGVKAYTWGPLAPTELAGAELPASLYYLARDTAGIAQLWVLGADGSPARQVTLEPRSVLDFGLSPDGSQIAYTAGGNLVRANADGTGSAALSPVVDRPGSGAQPAWSPDGQLIAFVRDGIWLIPAGGGARTELLTDNFETDTPPVEIRIYMRPRWSPDGTMLLISVGYYEGSGLAVLPITGGEPLALPVGATEGAWLPDGRVLAWDAGFTFTEPGLYVIDPANPEKITILDTAWHVLDAMPLASEAAKILRAPAGDVLGPSMAQPFLVPVLPGALPIVEGQGGLIEAPELSPDGRFAAGLRNMSYGDYGPMGDLVIINLTTGERFALATPGAAWGLQWGGMP